ncbi:NADP-dependent oxidoreductase domain-containing protein 1 [Rhinophrynus dorsalis]
MMFGVTDLTAGLSSLQFGCGVENRYQRFLPLKKRSRLLTLNCCAHCVFFCKFLQCVRNQQVEGSCSLSTAPRITRASRHDSLRVGIIGGGHLGKQLACCLLDLSDVRAENIHISTRRPETLRELQDLGVHCFYDNAALTAWAHVVFLCCLPSQLPIICAEIREHLRDTCIVYSLVSAVPLSRLKQLLSHSGVIRPEYRCDGGEQGQDRGNKGTITADLRNALILKTTNLGNPLRGGVYVVSRLLETSVYAALNTCTINGLSHKQSLNILNSIIHQTETKGNISHGFLLGNQSFVSQEFASSLSEDSSFPLFDLCKVQMKETPFSQHLARSPWLQERFVELYYTCFGISPVQNKQE